MGIANFPDGRNGLSASKKRLKTQLIDNEHIKNGKDYLYEQECEC